MINCQIQICGEKCKEDIESREESKGTEIERRQIQWLWRPQQSQEIKGDRGGTGTEKARCIRDTDKEGECERGSADGADVASTDSTEFTRREGAGYSKGCGVQDRHNKLHQQARIRRQRNQEAGRVQGPGIETGCVL